MIYDQLNVFKENLEIFQSSSEVQLSKLNMALAKNDEYTNQINN